MTAPRRRTARARGDRGQAAARLAEREQQRTEARAELAARETERAAFEAWQRGEVVPHRITLALDMGQHYGPEVDEACLTKEPAVDEWEAGTRYPTWLQLRALAELTGFPIGFFLAPVDGDIHALGPGTMFACRRSARNWNPLVEIPAPVRRFTYDAIVAAVSGYCVACLDPARASRAMHTCEQTAIPLEVG